MRPIKAPPIKDIIHKLYTFCASSIKFGKIKVG